MDVLNDVWVYLWCINDILGVGVDDAVDVMTIFVKCVVEKTCLFPFFSFSRSCYSHSHTLLVTEYTTTAAAAPR